MPGVPGLTLLAGLRAQAPEACSVALGMDDSEVYRRAFRAARLVNPLMVARDGDEAVAYLAGEGEFADRARYPLPILLLLDLKLPRRSGLEVLEWLRRQPGLKRLPVVVLTTSREQGDVNRAYDLGANSYLVKPVALSALVDMVRTLDLYWVILNERPDLGRDAPPLPERGL